MALCSTDVLVSRRLTLRPPLEVDLEAIARGLNDFEVSRWLGQVPHPYRPTDARHWFEHIETGAKDRRWTIHDATGLVGVVSISGRVREEPRGDELELGYWLCRDRWGRGLMSEAAQTVLADHFGRGGRAVISGAQVENHASLAVQRKLGFEPTHEIDLPSRSLGRAVRVQRTRLVAERFAARTRKGIAA